VTARTRRPDAVQERTGTTTDTASERAALAPDDGPGLLDRLKARVPYLERVLRAATRYSEQRGGYFAAGITYYTVLALVPIVMVAFAALGFVLAGQPGLVQQVRDGVTTAVPGDLQTTVNKLVDTAITQRSKVGIVGLVAAVYSGLGWMSNIREGLTAVWRQHPPDKNFLLKKLGDLGAFLGLGLALVVSVLISVVGGASTSFVIGLVGLDGVPGAFILTRIVAIVLSILVSWMLFSWVIAKLPRVAVGLRSALTGALLAAVVFEGFKQAASYILKGTLSSPGFELFGPVIAILVFVFYTGQVVLFSTAFAATTEQSLRGQTVPVPGPAVVTTRLEISPAPNVGGVLTGVGVGVLALLGLGWRHRR
jgi:membrane protein